MCTVFLRFIQPRSPARTDGAAGQASGPDCVVNEPVTSFRFCDGMVEDLSVRTSVLRQFAILGVKRDRRCKHHCQEANKMEWKRILLLVCHGFAILMWLSARSRLEARRQGPGTGGHKSGHTENKHQSLA